MRRSERKERKGSARGKRRGREKVEEKEEKERKEGGISDEKGGCQWEKGRGVPGRDGEECQG